MLVFMPINQSFSVYLENRTAGRVAFSYRYFAADIRRELKRFI